MNLWQETINEIETDGYTLGNVKAVFGDAFQVTLENFREVAERTEYDNGYGGDEIATDLKILMDDGSWYERESYDGKSRWNHVEPPTVPDKVKTIRSVLTAPLRWTLADILTFGR